MKGTILKCLKSLVVEKFGEDKWEEICKKSDFNPFTIIALSSDFDDETAMKLLENTCTVLDLTLEQAADAFGDYWVNEYAVDIYKTIYDKFGSAKEFVLGMDEVHEKLTQSIKNARPPRFAYSEEDENTLLVTYKSNRNLIDVFIGLVKGLGRYYNQSIHIDKLSKSQVRIVFG